MPLDVNGGDGGVAVKDDFGGQVVAVRSGAGVPNPMRALRLHGPPAKRSGWRRSAVSLRLCGHDRFHSGVRDTADRPTVYAVGDIHGCLDRLEALHGLRCN